MAVVNSQRLDHVGPRDPQHGFPMWYEDGGGTRLALALGPDQFTPAGEQPPSPGAPIVFPTNFPEEAFFFYAEAELPVGGAGVIGRARLVLALEAAFGGAGLPAEGARVVFARIRVRMDDVVPGASYVVTHPYGVTDAMEADDRGRVFVTEDLGVADEDFASVLSTGRVAPFLRWTAAPPPGHLGDGTTARTVTGSPFGTNFFRIDGPRVAEGGGTPDPADPTNPDRVQTDLFTVQGRIATQHGAEVTRATFTRTAGGTVQLDVFARSAPGQTLELGDPRVAAVAADRDYLVHADVPTPPTSVTVVNATDTPATRTSAPVTDLVVVSRAELDAGAQTLTVEATSSDATGPTLTAEGYGALTAGPTVFTGVGAAPGAVVVSSAGGGRGRGPVTVVGPGAATLPAVAGAGPDQTVVTGSTVTLDGTSSRGAVTSFVWSLIAGTPVALTGDTTPTATFTAPPPGQLTFGLTVTGPGGSATDDVTVTVDPVPPPDVLSVDRCDFRTSRQQWRVGGTVTGTLPNEVVVMTAGQELGRSPVDATGAWDVRRTLTAADAPLVPSVGDTVTASSVGGGATTAPVNIRN